MANNCWNWVSITGCKSSLDRIESKFKKYDQTDYFTEFGDIVLEKKTRQYKEQPFEFYYYYGTKWWDIDMDRNSDECLVISGDTAWSPPLELMKRVSRRYQVEVLHEFEEPGCDFAGVHTYKNGEVIDRKDYTYDEYRYIDNYESWWDDMIDRINDNPYDTWEEFVEDFIDDSVLNIISSKDLQKLKDVFNEKKIKNEKV